MRESKTTPRAEICIEFRVFRAQNALLNVYQLPPDSLVVDESGDVLDALGGGQGADDVGGEAVEHQEAEDETRQEENSGRDRLGLCRTALLGNNTYNSKSELNSRLRDRCIQRDETMISHMRHDSWITLNNGLGTLKTKSGGGYQGGGKGGGMCRAGILS